MFDRGNRGISRSGSSASVGAFHQIRCQAPGPLVVVVAIILLGPQLALMAVLLAQYSRVQLSSILIEWAPLTAVKLAFLTLIGLIKVPTLADTEGIRFAWFYRMAWSDIASAQIRSRFGLRLLEIRQHNGYTWRIWLYWFRELPMFLAAYAPVDSPLHGIQ